MDKTKDFEIEVDGIKRVFRFHPVKWSGVAKMRDAVNNIASNNGKPVEMVCDAIIDTIEMIGADGTTSLGMCKKNELEALLDPFAMYELICAAVDHQVSFCKAYPNSLVLISVVRSLVCSGDLE